MSRAEIHLFSPFGQFPPQYPTSLSVCTPINESLRSGSLLPIFGQLNCFYCCSVAKSCPALCDYMDCNNFLEEISHLSHSIVFFFLFICIVDLRRPSYLSGFPDSSAGKESTCNAGDLGLIPGLGRSSGGGKGYPLQCSGPENPMDSPWGHKELDRVE